MSRFASSPSRKPKWLTIMLLLSIDAEEDSAVLNSVNIIKQSTNAFACELDYTSVSSYAQISQSISSAGQSHIVFVSHGSRDALLNSQRPRQPYVTVDDAKEFADRYLLAHACSSGAYLGEIISQYAYVYIGFDSVISAPPDPSSTCYGHLRLIYERLLSYFANLGASSPVQAKEAAYYFLNDLREAVLQVERCFDTGEGSLLSAEELICFLQFREDICIWVRRTSGATKSKGARTRPTIW